MSPDCGYSLDVTPKLRVNDGSYLDLPVPLSLSYNSDNELIVGKCSSTTFSLDGECQNEPYEIVYDVVF